MFSADLGVTPSSANYIEDVFSTYLYAGNSSTQTITNGIDLSTKGGLVWGKARNASDDHNWYDTVRGAALSLSSNNTDLQISRPNSVTSFNTNGYTLGSNTSDNFSSRIYVSWTFREQAKFFDVVTYTGTGAVRTVSHNLGSAPGFIIVKRTDLADEWFCYHRSLGSNNVIWLNLQNATGSAPNMWNNTAPTSTVFTLGTDTGVNANGGSYVAYLFAHDAGGFGATGSDNVISCGSFTTDGSGNATVSLGYEPQWALIKASSTTSSWFMVDQMRGFTVSSAAVLFADSNGDEAVTSGLVVNSTGFQSVGLSASTTYIYIAIRRGPMKTPTVGTSVFSPVQSTSASTPLTVTTNFAVDLTIARIASIVNNTAVMDRLRGGTTTTYNYLRTNGTNAESVGSGAGIGFQYNDSVVDNGFLTGSSDKKIYWNFRRAPGFFDVVCYTGTGANRTVSHNLGAVPELMIVKRRDTVEDWNVYNATIGNTAYLRLNTTAASATAGGDALWGSTTPTSSVFTVKTSGGTNASGGTYVAYLFATVAGVSKVGSYTGTGTTNQINCGFTGGARFVLIKRTDSTGDWYVWDSARGIVAGDDPYLLLNSTAAEVTNTDYVDTYSAGFEISSTAPAAINANGGSFIFLAIA